jgi:hypothetical protein
MNLAIHQWSRSTKPLGSPHIVASCMSHAVLSQAKKVINKIRLTMAYGLQILGGSSAENESSWLNMGEIIVAWAQS